MLILNVPFVEIYCNSLSLYLRGANKTILSRLTTLCSLSIIPTMSIENTSNKKISLDDLPDLLTIREVAEILRVSPLTIKRWGKRGKLPAIRINSRGDRRYRKEVILRLLGVESTTV